MLIPPSSSQPGPMKGAFVFLEFLVFMWITGRHKWMEVVAQQLYVPICIREVGKSTKDPRSSQRKHPRPWLSRHDLLKFKPGAQDPWIYELGAIFSASHQREVFGIETHQSMLLVSSSLESIFCVLLLRQDVQPDGVLWAMVLSRVYCARSPWSERCMIRLLTVRLEPCFSCVAIWANVWFHWLRTIQLSPPLPRSFKDTCPVQFSGLLSFSSFRVFSVFPWYCRAGKSQFSDDFGNRMAHMSSVYLLSAIKVV